MKVKFGEIEKRRKALKLSREQLAEKSRTTPEFIQGLESGMEDGAIPMWWLMRVTQSMGLKMHMVLKGI